MIKNTNYQSIAPLKVIRGESAWEESKQLIKMICKKPLLLGRSSSTENIRNVLKSDLINIGLNTISGLLKYDCCEEDLNQILQISKDNNCDAIIAAGGGKVLDAGKLIANRLSIPVITIPLSAATCAGWTALSNIYSPNGAFIKDEILNSCPDLLIFDYSFIRKAPPRTLASGIADALAKWYESSLTSSASNDGLVQQAVQLARVLRDQLLIDSQEAFKNVNSDSWIRIVEGCALTAGLIGGVGGSNCRTAIAHPMHNGLTQLNFSKKPLHGEIVGVGIIIQLHLEELNSNNQLAKQARLQLTEFLEKLELPTDIKSLGLNDISINNLKKACEFACNKNSDIHKLPFEVKLEQLFKATLASLNISQTTLEKRS